MPPYLHHHIGIGFSLGSLITLEECQARDSVDLLRELRHLFDLRPDLIYLDGNSLGPPTKSTRAAIERAIDDWRDQLIGGWWESAWIDLPRVAGARLEAIVGAEPGTVVCTDSTTVNLYKAVSALCDDFPGDLLTDSGNFPSVLYVLGAIGRQRGRQVRIVPPEDVLKAIDREVGVACLTQVDFRTGRMHDMEAITGRAHDVGARVTWDLSHSAGVVPIDLAGCGVDAAVGCGYKYLNGGPGAPAFIYVAPHLDLQNPISGWFSHRSPFAFSPIYEPAVGIDRFRTGTPHVLSLAAFAESLKAFDGLSMSEVRAKSLALTSLFIDLIDQEVSCEVLTPRAFSDRGSQVSLRLDKAQQLVSGLGTEGVIADYRPPDVARFGFSPLYLAYEDVWRAVAAIRSVLAR